jgi:amidohydrolase
MPTLPELRKNFIAPSLDLPWESDIVALRRDFHAHPELGFEEVRTSGIVAQRLRALGLEVTEGVGTTGVVAVLDSGRPGPRILVRADMDALPILEENDWEWKSTNHGKMHACGHDAHTAIGLSVARILASERESLVGTVVFMFQPAEEGLGGAGRMIRDGLLNDPRPDFALALHVWSPLEKGTIGVSSGPVMACTDEFRARIIGKGGHGALPHQTIDPILVAAHVVTALQSIVSRNVKPLDSAVVTVGKFQAGSAFNVIPSEVLLEGTIRAFDADVRQILTKRCQEIIETLPKAFGARGEYQLIEGFPAVVNDASVVQKILPALQKVAGAENVSEFEPTLGAEDFSVVLEEIPGCYFFVGARNEEIDAVYPHHHPKFNLDESALHLGTQALVAAVKELLS